MLPFYFTFASASSLQFQISQCAKRYSAIAEASARRYPPPPAPAHPELISVGDGSWVAPPPVIASVSLVTSQEVQGGEGGGSQPTWRGGGKPGRWPATLPSPFPPPPPLPPNPTKPPPIHLSMRGPVRVRNETSWGVGEGLIPGVRGQTWGWALSLRSSHSVENNPSSMAEPVFTRGDLVKNFPTRFSKASASGYFRKYDA